MQRGSEVSFDARKTCSCNKEKWIVSGHIEKPFCTAVTPAKARTCVRSKPVQKENSDFWDLRKPGSAIKFRFSRVSLQLGMMLYCMIIVFWEIVRLGWLDSGLQAPFLHQCHLVWYAFCQITLAVGRLALQLCPLLGENLVRASLIHRLCRHWVSHRFSHSHINVFIWTSLSNAGIKALNCWFTFKAVWQFM